MNKRTATIVVTLTEFTDTGELGLSMETDEVNQDWAIQTFINEFIDMPGSVTVDGRVIT
jgi:hypothetical protein